MTLPRTATIRAMLQTLRTPGDTRWYTHARFGLFIHWGVYSQLGDGEWPGLTAEPLFAAFERLCVATSADSRASATAAIVLATIIWFASLAS